MEKIVEKDILKALEDGEIDAILHCVGCHGDMDSGLALEIKNKYPSVYLDYLNFCREMVGLDKNKLLGFSRMVRVHNGSIINLIAQLKYTKDNRKINYGALGEALSFSTLELARGSKVGLPYRMCSEEDGGDWNVVKELIEYYLGAEYKIYYYKMPPSV